MRARVFAATLFVFLCAGWTLTSAQRASRPPAPQGSTPAAQGSYFPDRFDWQHKKPEEVGMNAAVHFVGNGNNFVYIDWENDLVVVTRWMNNTRGLNTVVEKLMASMKPAPTTASLAKD